MKALLFRRHCWWLLLLLAAVAVVNGDATYDGRSLIIDGQQKILFSGSIHYPRSTPQGSWRADKLVLFTMDFDQAEAFLSGCMMYLASTFDVITSPHQLARWQIENEYQTVEPGYGPRGPPYVKWAAAMAVGLQTGVPWMMCKQDDAPDPVVSFSSPLPRRMHPTIFGTLSGMRRPPPSYIGLLCSVLSTVAEAWFLLFLFRDDNNNIFDNLS